MLRAQVGRTSVQQGLVRVAWGAVALALVSTPAASAEDAGVAALCTGEYADSAAALAPNILRTDNEPQEPYSFCLRSQVVYECLAYGADGDVRKMRRKVKKHGTGFAYRRQGNETLLVTNFHVAEWPSVTSEEDSVGDVPNGCKRVSYSLNIVDNEDDAYDRDDVPLTRLVNDPVIDVSIVKAQVPLRVLPWKVGRSASLKARNVVEVRGFPLGAFRATSTGKVIAPYDPHIYRDGEHADFVIDALLSQGNSGSPVLAISCETGEYELVGVYHAAYTRGTALNVVVGIDQIRDLMTTLKRSPRPKTDLMEVSTAADRARLLQAAKLEPEPFFPFGPLTAAVRVSPEGALLFEVFDEDFPTRVVPVLMLEDAEIPALPDGGTPRVPDYRVFFGGIRGLKGYSWSTLDAEAMALVEKMREALRHDALLAFDVRAGLLERNRSRERFDALTKLERKLKKLVATRKELASALDDLTERLGPAEGEAGLTLSQALLAPITVPTVPLRVEGPPRGQKPPPPNGKP